MSDSTNTGNTISDTIAGAAKAVGDNASWLANKITGETHEAQRKAAGEAVTSDQTTLGQKVDGAKTWVTEGSKEAKDKAAAEKDNQKSEYHNPSS